MAITLASNVFVKKDEIREFVFKGKPEEIIATEEDLIYRIANGICKAIERYIKKYVIIQTGLTHYDDGGHDEIYLPYYPVTEVTEVLENGSALASSQYHLYSDIGMVARDSGMFYAGRRAVKITYSSGYGTQTVEDGEVTAISDVPEDIRLAALIWISIIWDAGPATYSPRIEDGVIVYPKKIPYQVAQLLEPYGGSTVI